MTTPNVISVNRLPSLTWNRLGVNKAIINLDDLPKADKEALYSEFNTEQIKKETLPSPKALAFSDSFSGGIRREAYIAAKRAIYQEQDFATGLGKDFTDYIAELAPETDVYTLEENQKVEKPIILRWDFGSGAKAAAQQVIYAKKGSSATFIITEASELDAYGNGAYETKVILEESAKIHLVKVHLLGSKFVLMDDTAAVLGEKAEFDFTQMALGGAKIYAGCYADQTGSKSKFNVDTGYMADYDHLIDLNYIACQRGTKTESKINVRGSLKDNAKKVFRGTIDFRKGSKGSVGEEQEDVLLLDPGAINKTVPVILTEEEEVAGHHGATVGNLSKEVLFYMGTRGIAKKEAEMLMTRGRLLSIANLIPDEKTVHRISAFVKETFSTDE